MLHESLGLISDAVDKGVDTAMQICVCVYRYFLVYPPSSEGRIRVVDNSLKRSPCLRYSGDRSAVCVDNEYGTPRGAS